MNPDAVDANLPLEGTRVALRPEGQAWLVGRPGELVVEAPGGLRTPWRIGSEEIALVEWFNPARSVFRSQAVEPMRGSPVPFMIRYRGQDPDVRIVFRQPMVVPIRTRRWFEARRLVVGPTPRGGDLVSKLIGWRDERRSVTTSLEFKGLTGPEELLPVLLHAGFEFPTYGEPM